MHQVQLSGYPLLGGAQPGPPQTSLTPSQGAGAAPCRSRDLLPRPAAGPAPTSPPGGAGGGLSLGGPALPSSSLASAPLLPVWGCVGGGGRAGAAAAPRLSRGHLAAAARPARRGRPAAPGGALLAFPFFFSFPFIFFFEGGEDGRAFARGIPEAGVGWRRSGGETLPWSCDPAEVRGWRLWGRLLGWGGEALGRAASPKKVPEDSREIVCRVTRRLSSDCGD